MITTGLVSVTFCKLVPAEIIALVQQAGLIGIEWCGDIHVPHGDLARAREVRQRTLDAGLTVAAYGSYYRVNQSEVTGLRFETVLETGEARGEMQFRQLHALTIRDFTGQKNAIEKPVAKLFQRLPDAPRLDDVQSRAGNVHGQEYERKAIWASSRRWRAGNELQICSPKESLP